MKNFKLILKSLVNNEACVEGGRHRPWWIALIMFFVSMIISLVPIFVQRVTVEGSNFVSTTYAYETGAQRFVEEINTKELSMVVSPLEGSDNYLEVNKDKWDAAFTTVDEASQLHVYQHFDANSQLDFEAFYLDSENISNDTAKLILNNVKVEKEDGTVSYDKRKTSVLIWAKKEFLSYSYNTLGSQIGSIIGDYKNIQVGTDVRDFAKVTINDTVYSLDDIKLPENNKLAKDYYNGVWNNWKSFFDKGYEYNKGQLTWRTTLLMFGINAVLVIFMGFMIWVLTRGKTNPFRVYSFLECEFISAWASVAPAILALALGFLIAQISQIIFPILIGLRVMWLSMKTLRPEYVVDPKQSQSVKTVNAKQIKK